MYGKYLKQAREMTGYSQSKTAKLTGLNQQMISHWENNKGLPNIDFCIKLANCYEITLDELVGRDFKQKNITIDQRENKGTINNNF